MVRALGPLPIARADSSAGCDDAFPIRREFRGPEHFAMTQEFVEFLAGSAVPETRGEIVGSGEEPLAIVRESNVCDARCVSRALGNLLARFDFVDEDRL